MSCSANAKLQKGFSCRWGDGLTGGKFPCKIVGVLDAGVHPKAASWGKAVRCISRQECIAHLQRS